MWFVFLIVLIGTSEAVYDEISDYWYSSNDGANLNDAPLKISRDNEPIDKKNIMRSMLQRNLTSTLRSPDYESSDSEVSTSSEEQNLSNDNFEDGSTLRIRTLLNKYVKKSLTLEEASQCVDGPVKYVSCYQCFCIGGHLYVCSSQKCPVIENLNLKKVTGVYQHSNKLAGLIQEEPECIEGQAIHTTMCKECICLDGQVYCHSRSCYNEDIHTLKKYSSDEDQDNTCVKGDVIPSPDNCNKCKCSRGRIVCTTRACGPIVKTAYKHCAPKRWHSLQMLSSCRECYCVDGEVSFCYLDYCTTRFESLKGVQLQNVALKYHMKADEASSSCSPGEKKTEKCIRCECNELNKWRCWTKRNHHCKARRVQAICEPSQYFTLGVADTCQGCHCTEDRSWKCWSVKGSCSENEECPVGDLMKNPLSPCSVCYCGIDGTNMCTTDEHCAHVIRVKELNNDISGALIRRRRCDSVKCLSKCYKQNKIGVCIAKKGCVCK